MTDSHILNAFESVGIPRMQTTIYLDLLKNKESTATEISKRTKMHRANVYDTLSKLKERNLVYLTSKEGKQVFAALSTDLIEEKNKESENINEVHVEIILKENPSLEQNINRLFIFGCYKKEEGENGK